MKVLLFIGMLFSTSGLLANKFSPSFSLAEKEAKKQVRKIARLKAITHTHFSDGQPPPRFRQVDENLLLIENVLVNHSTRVDRLVSGCGSQPVAKHLTSLAFFASFLGNAKKKRKVYRETKILLDTLPPDSLLFQSLATYYHQKTQAELAEFQETEKGEWLKYLPSVGITYTFDNKPRPIATLSTSTLYNAKKSKQARAAKRKAIIQINALAHQQDRLRLQQLLNQYRLEKEALEFQAEILEIDKQLFAIEEAKYEKNQIPPSEFLKIKRGYMVKAFEITEKQRLQEINRGEIIVLAKDVD